jgi:hypothetical protein
MARNKTINGQAGGRATVRRYGTEYMRTIGSIGGNTVVNKYGTAYMSLLGELANPSLSQRRRQRISRAIENTVANANR